MSKEKTTALTVLSAPKLRAASSEIDSLKQAAIGQCEAIARMENQAAIGGVLAGLTLHRVKASLKHGEFLPWLSNSTMLSNFTPAYKSRIVNHYMRLAIAFIEDTGADVDNLLALGGEGEMLELAETGAGQALLAKLKKFAGDHSLNELLIKHGIKGVGLKSSLEKEVEKENPESPEVSMERAREAAWEQGYFAITQVRAIFCDPIKVQMINDPEKIRLLKSELVEINRLADERLATLRTITI